MPVVFFALWVLLNGRLTWEIAAFGVVLSGALYWFCVKFLDYDPKKELRFIRLVPTLISYLFLVVKEIFKSNWSLMKIVFSRKMEIKPQLVTFHTPLPLKGLQCLLADSITLTPGTLTVLLEDGELTVHCLDEQFAQGIEDLEFQHRLMKMYEKMEAPRNEH